MNKGDYYQVELTAASQLEKDVMVARLADIGFEGFVEEKNSLKAFIPAEHFSEDCKKLIEEQGAEFKITEIQNRNWNAEWESNFEPVVVNNFCSIRADFHP